MQSKLVAESAGRRTFVMILDPRRRGLLDHFEVCRRAKARRRLPDGARCVLQGDGRLVRPCGQDLSRDPGSRAMRGAERTGDIAVDDGGKPSLHMHRARFERRHDPRRPSSRTAGAADARSNLVYRLTQGQSGTRSLGQAPMLRGQLIVNLCVRHYTRLKRRCICGGRNVLSSGLH
jgi:hypothetical protein